MSDVGAPNGHGTAMTVKELVLEHDAKLDRIQDELSKAKGALYLAVALGIVNVMQTLLEWAPAMRGATGQ